MDWLRLTSLAVTAAAALLLCLVVLGYLLSLKTKTAATRLLIVFLGLWAVFILHTISMGAVLWSRVYALSPLGGVLLLFAAAVLLHFAYVFLGDPFHRESRFVTRSAYAIAAVLSLHPLYACVYGLVTVTTKPPPFFWYPAVLILVFLLLFVGSGIVFLRKSAHYSREADPGTLAWWRVLRRPAGQKGRALRVFAAICLLPLLTIVPISLGLRPSVMQSFAFVQIAVLVFAYVSYAPEPTTVQVKLVGATLIATLGVVIGLVVILDLERKEAADPEFAFPAQIAYQFTPDPDGGYLVERISASLDDEMGQAVRPYYQHSVRAGLDFAFPFYGSTYDTLFVDDDPMVYFGRELQSFDQMRMQFTENVQPKIVPLLVNICPDGGSEGSVYVKQSSSSATITWYQGRCLPEAPKTVQLVLRDGGTFTFVYGDVGGSMVDGTVSSFGAVLGVYPGGSGADFQEFDLGQNGAFRLGRSEGFLDDIAGRFREQLHHEMAPFLWALLVATAFSLLFIPFFFRISLIAPLARLLDGVRRVDAGDREVEVPVTTPDEIGRLAQHFNRMSGSLRDAEGRLKAYAEELEKRVEARTAELEASNAKLAEQKVALEANQKQLQEQAERLQELDAIKSRFFANTSHELRTPLTLLLGPIEDALAPDADLEQFHAQLPMMRRNAKRLLALVNQLLDLARLEAGGMHLRAMPIDLVSFTREITHTFDARADRDTITLLFNSDLETFPVRADPDKVEKVVTNLVANALKFTDQGGKVSVRVQQLRDATGTWAEVVVRDTGRGISSVDLPHIFDRFHQAVGDPMRQQGGTGLGLALVRELVDLHGGTITVTSVERFGSTFTVRLPVVTEQQAGGVWAHTDGTLISRPSSDTVPGIAVDDIVDVGLRITEPDEAADRPTVLVVEDNADLRTYLRRHLAENYRMIEAVDGRVGLEAARRFTPDLIISDVMMPEMDGYELCRTVKMDPDLDHIPVVLLTARADEASKLEGLELGADDFLAKPFNAEELLLRVENLIDLRRRMQERFGGRVVVSRSDVVVASADAAFVEQVRDVIEAHLGDSQFGVDWLASEVGLSGRQLLRRLKDAAGLTPQGYIRMLRLERAAQLLEQRAGSVSEIAYQVGFNQPDYFARLFRQVFGVPPSDYAGEKS